MYSVNSNKIRHELRLAVMYERKDTSKITIIEFNKKIVSARKMKCLHIKILFIKSKQSIQKMSLSSFHSMFAIYLV